MIFFNLLQVTIDFSNSDVTITVIKNSQCSLKNHYYNKAMINKVAALQVTHYFNPVKE